MKTLAWSTDIHLNFVSAAGTEAFLRSGAATGADAFLVGGDIAEAGSLADTLRALDRGLERPVYFVLGNHDFYGGGIEETRAAAEEVCRGSRRLRWLSGSEPVALSDRTGLIGHDGWGDARIGDFEGSGILLNDFLRIRDLVTPDRAERGRLLRALGDQAARQVRPALRAALDRFEEIVFLTHVPPFREACWHEGKISAEDWLPFFTCKALGDELRGSMAARPDRRMTVLCGHTHGAGEAVILPNLRTVTGGAEYREPRWQEPLLRVP